MMREERGVQWLLPLTVAVIAAGTGCGNSTTASPDNGSSGIDSGLEGQLADANTSGSGDASPDGGSDAGIASPDGGSDAGMGFVPSNVPFSSFPSGARDVTITGAACVADTDALTVDCIGALPDGGFPYVFMAGKQSDGSSVSVLAVNSLTIPSAAALTVKGSVPFIVWANETVDVEGSLTALQPFLETNGGGFIQTPAGPGGGPGGGGSGTMNPQIGGGGGGYCGPGGAGANSQTISGDGGASTPGGPPYGNATITPLVGGSSGGAPATVGQGGEGGGAIEITAGQSIAVPSGGSISAPGYGATGNGGGGGSGGAILLEAPVVTIGGVLAANGGGAAVFSGGGGAQAGQPNAQPAMGEDANSATGSAGTQIAGADGAATQIATSAGGGGAGRIRINTATGMATIATSAIVSPALSTPCATEGALVPAH